MLRKRLSTLRKRQDMQRKQLILLNLRIRIVPMYVLQRFLHLLSVHPRLLHLRQRRHSPKRLLHPSWMNPRKLLKMHVPHTSTYLSFLRIPILSLAQIRAKILQRHLNPTRHPQRQTHICSVLVFLLSSRITMLPESSPALIIRPPVWLS